MSFRIPSDYKFEESGTLTLTPWPYDWILPTAHAFHTKGEPWREVSTWSTLVNLRNEMWPILYDDS